MPDDPQPSIAWLWAEIERQYGAEAAEVLRHAFNVQSSSLPPIDEQIILACSITNPDQAMIIAEQLQQAGYTITAARVVALGTIRNVCSSLCSESEERSEAIYQICRRALDLPAVPTAYQRFIAAQTALAGAGYTVMRWHGWLVVRQAGHWVAALETIEQLEVFVSEHLDDPPRV